MLAVIAVIVSALAVLGLLMVTVCVALVVVGGADRQTSGLKE